MKKLMLAVTALTLIGGAAPAFAAPCKDAHGKFVKCPAPKVAAAKPARCRNAHGHFIKCPVKSRKA